MNLKESSELWDAVVVGAGPAGCAAAFDLAQAGLAVLLLDKSDFPRHKACAGGLTVKAVKALRYPIDPVVREVIRKIRLQDGDRSTSLKSREAICVMTVRTELDQYCLNQTVTAGAHFRRIASVRQIVTSASMLHLHTNEEIFRTRFLVGADGASGQVRRLCGRGSWFSQGFALEVQAWAPEPGMEPGIDLTFDFAAVADGYGWIFPKKDHLNIGVYVGSSSSGLTKSALLRYVTETAGAKKLDPITGQYLGMGAGSDENEFVQPELRDRVLLVGDAGGFVDPLTGEGIYGALHSGQGAAHAILRAIRQGESAPEAFARSVAAYRKTLRFSIRAAAAFYANRGRGFKAMRLPFVRRTMVKTYTHGLNVDSLAMRIALSQC
ncbi:MAG: geranylgeranyl reductase family protein [Acidobacteriaceae bacterium]